MIPTLIIINVIIYMMIIVKCFMIQDKTPFFFNYLIISCLLMLVFFIVLFSELYFPVFNPVHYKMKNFLLIFQFLYFLLYFSKHNFFYNKSFEKFFSCLLQFFILLFFFIFMAAFFPGESWVMRFLHYFINWISIIFLVILYSLYIIPTLSQKKFSPYFRRLIVLFLIDSFLSNIFIMIPQVNQSILVICLISNLIFSAHFLNFIAAKGGRYLND
jgi:hypothetical protein